MHLGIPFKFGQKSHTDDVDARAAMAAAGIIGPSVRIREVTRQLEHAARAVAGLMIVGDEGTEGEIVAQAIHLMGRRGQVPFVQIHCDTISPGRVEHELFGYVEPGGGSPAAPDRLGVGSLLQKARGGTALFTHLEELPDRVQARLGQILRDGEALVGSSERPEPLNIWPMTVVGKGFQNEVEEGRVRPALANRFSESRIFLPPLRERREDIPTLVQHYLEMAASDTATSTRPISQLAMALLSAFEWQGNTRELRTLVEAMAGNGRSDEIGLDEILEHLQRKGPGIGRGLNLPIGATLRQARQQFEREFITAVLAQHHGRIPEAARSLGIQRTNLYRKIRSLRLSRAPERPVHD